MSVVYVIERDKWLVRTNAAGRVEIARSNYSDWIEIDLEAVPHLVGDLQAIHQLAGREAEAAPKEELLSLEEYRREVSTALGGLKTERTDQPGAPKEGVSA